MLIQFCKSKIAHAKITEAELYYEGSITIDEDLMDEARLRTGEQVHVVNLHNGARLVTYVIVGPRGSKAICLNGPAARCGEIGDPIFILSYAIIDPDKEELKPTIVHLESGSH